MGNEKNEIILTKIPLGKPEIIWERAQWWELWKKVKNWKRNRIKKLR